MEMSENEVSETFYEVVYLPAPGKQPRRVVIDISAVDLQAPMAQHRTRLREKTNLRENPTSGARVLREFMETEGCALVDKLLVSWNSPVQPCQLPFTLRFIQRSGYPLLRIATRLQSGTPISEGELGVWGIQSARPLPAQRCQRDTSREWENDWSSKNDGSGEWRVAETAA